MSSSTEVVWHGDGREQSVFNHILHHANLDDFRGKPEAIISAIDRWSEDNNILMTIGSNANRGDLVLSLISEVKPRTMVELGGYIGYSAIKFGSAARNAGGLRYISLEQSAEYAGLAKSLVELAGLQDFVQILVGSSSESLAKLAQQDVKIDMLFIDHHEGLFLTDLKLSEQHGMLSSGSYIIADNICGSKAGEYVIEMQSKEELQNPLATEGRRTQPSTNENGTYETYTSYFKLPTGEPDGIMISRRI